MPREFMGAMTTDEAVDYLNESLDEPLSRSEFHEFRVWLGVPVGRQAAGRLWFYRGDINEFLAKYGTNPAKWVGPGIP